MHRGIGFGLAGNSHLGHLLPVLGPDAFCQQWPGCDSPVRDVLHVYLLSAATRGSRAGCHMAHRIYAHLRGAAGDPGARHVRCNDHTAWTAIAHGLRSVVAKHLVWDRRTRARQNTSRPNDRADSNRCESPGDPDESATTATNHDATANNASAHTRTSNDGIDEMIHLITFSLNPKRDATALFQELQSYASWMHYIDDTWLISSNRHILAVWDGIAKHTLPTDRVLIVPIIPDQVVWGNMPKDAWEWINLHRGTRYPADDPGHVPPLLTVTPPVAHRNE